MADFGAKKFFSIVYEFSQYDSVGDSIDGVLEGGIGSVMPNNPNGLTDAVQWIERLMLGSVATGISVVAVAVFGLILLDGRMEWHRGARAVLGCFLIFAAPTISLGLMGMMSGRTGARVQPTPVNASPPPIRPDEPFDPYAGAALHRR